MNNKFLLLFILSKNIIKSYKITQANFLAHSDLDPLRKYDLGKLFQLERLCKGGI
ncbi:MAG: hypothetical protein ACEY3J_04220 [Arsenophonus sp.]